jgi:hypothetical protein
MKLLLYVPNHIKYKNVIQWSVAVSSNLNCFVRLYIVNKHTLNATYLLWNQFPEYCQISEEEAVREYFYKNLCFYFSDETTILKYRLPELTRIFLKS